ncbi:hypothetical protein SSAG_01126 [Streptomyces sp. Mg1]|nr:hypothetical protein SSAG_01126 [Streptomyces sp. Mg1]
MPFMELLPIPCPPELVPDVTGEQASAVAYAAARAASTTFVGIERGAGGWTVKMDRHPVHIVDHGAAVAVGHAVRRLVAAGEADRAAAGPDGLVVHGVADEERARELAAAFHAALYGDLAPLARAVREGT